MPSPHLERKLKEVLGDDAGQELAAVTDKIDPLRGDVAELGHKMDLGFSRMETILESALRKQTQFFFLAWAALLAAVVGLYGR